MFAISTPMVFLPIGSRQGANTSGENWAEYWSFFEAIRFVCIAWIALMVGQQVVKSEFIKTGQEVITNAAISVSKAIQEGRQSGSRAESFNRSPHFTDQPSFIVQAQSPTKVVAVPTRPVIEELVRDESRGVEEFFVWVGLVVGSVALAMRLIYILAKILGKA